jgi:hypothetical protein
MSGIEIIEQVDSSKWSHKRRAVLSPLVVSLIFYPVFVVAGVIPHYRVVLNVYYLATDGIRKYSFGRTSSSGSDFGVSLGENMKVKEIY